MPSCSSVLQLRCLLATLGTALATFQTVLASLELLPSWAGGSDRHGSASAPAPWELPAGLVRGLGAAVWNQAWSGGLCPTMRGSARQSWGCSCGCTRVEVAVLHPGLAWLHRGPLFCRSPALVLVLGEVSRWHHLPCAWSTASPLLRTAREPPQ